MFRFQLVLVALFCCFFSSFQAELFNVYLKEITIYQDHETSFPFSSNYPEVYLSCDDGLRQVELKQVRRTRQLYEFRLGDIRATRVSRDGCVKCSLKESDSTALLADDTFGSWWMCQDDFAKSGYHPVSKAGEFLILFQCPDCIEEPPEVVPPAPEPVEDTPASEPAEELEMAAASSLVPELDEDLGEEVGAELVDGYYGFRTTIEGTPSNSDALESGDVVLLQSEASDSAASGEGSSGGTSVLTVLSLCFTFLVVGIAIGVALFWRVVAMSKQDIPVDVVELAKSGFIMKKANKY